MWNLLQDELGGGVWPRLLVALVDTGAKGLILMAAAGLAAAAMRRNAAAARHLVWMLALCGLLLLPLVSLMMPKWTLPILPAIEAPAVAPIAAAPPIVTAPAAPAVVSTPMTEIAPEVPNVIPPTARSERPLAPIGATPPESVQAPINIGPWLLSTWLAFALLTVAPFAAGVVAVARMRGRTHVFADDNLQALATALGRTLGLKRPARLLCGPAGSMPMATGFLRPAVFLPDDALGWTEEKRRVVLLHELAHVKRRDCLAHAIARTATSLHWFNPLAWFALRQLRIEREHACDDLVLAAGERPSAYAENLLEIARTLHAKSVVSAAAITMAQKSQMEGRLLAVLDAARNRSVPTPRVVAGLFFIAGMACAVIATCRLTPAAATGPLERETLAAGVTAQSQERGFVATYANGLQARLLGVGEPDGYTVTRVWAPDGESLSGVPEGFKSKMGGSDSNKSGVTRRFFIEVFPVPEESDLGIKFKVEGNSVSHIVDRSQGRRCVNVQIYNIPDNPGGTSLELGIAAGPWESVHGTTGPHSTLDGSTFSAAYSDFFEKDGKAHFVVTHTPRDDDYRLAVYDKNDKPYPTRETSSSGVSTMRQTEFVVDDEVRASDLLYMDLQARSFEWKTISGISLNPIDDTTTKSARTLDTLNRWSSPSGEAPPEDASELPALNSIAFSRPEKWPSHWWNMDGSDTLPILPSNYKPSASASLSLVAETYCNREFSLVLRGTGLEDIERSVGATTEKTSFHMDSKELTAHIGAAHPVELVLRAGSGDWTEVTTLVSRKRAKTNEGSFEITDEHPIRPKNRWFLPDVPAKVLVQLRYDFDPRWEIAIVAEDKDGNRSGVNTSVGNGGISTRSTARVRSQMVEMPLSQISHYVVLKRPVYEFDCGSVPTAPKAARMDQASPAEDAAVVSNAGSNGSPYSVFNHDYLGTLLEDPNLLTHIAGDAITPPAADTSWGSVVNGLQAAVRFIPEKDTYALGETIGMEFLARNTLDTKAPSMQASTETTLGPEVEVTVRHSGENCMIDLDTGELFTPPNFNGTEDAFAWCAKNGIDAGGGNQPEVRGLIGMDLLLNPEDVTALDNAATNLALNYDEFKFDMPRNPVYFGATDPLPATWTFKTREGGRGIFQILGSDHDEPKAVRIRYRMLGKGSK